MTPKSRSRSDHADVGAFTAIGSFAILVWVLSQEPTRTWRVAAALAGFVIFLAMELIELVRRRRV